MNLLTVRMIVTHALLTLGIVYTISESTIVMPLRRVVVACCPKPLLPFLVQLLYCTRCLGFWVGAALGGALLHGPWRLTLAFGVLGMAEMHIVYGYFITQSVDPWVATSETETKNDEDK